MFDELRAAVVDYRSIALASRGSTRRRAHPRLRRPAATRRRDPHVLPRHDRERQHRTRADRTQSGADPAEKLRNEFVHHVSYELRSPLTNIIGFIQLLTTRDSARSTPNSANMPAIMTIRRTRCSPSSTIFSISPRSTRSDGAVARGGRHRANHAGGGGRRPGPARRLRDRLARRGDGGYRVLCADGKRIRQIFFNLLSNAIGFSTPAKPSISRRCGATAEILFKVTDRGAEFLPKSSNMFSTGLKPIPPGRGIAAPDLAFRSCGPSSNCMGAASKSIRRRERDAVTCIFPVDPTAATAAIPQVTAPPKTQSVR